MTNPRSVETQARDEDTRARIFPSNHPKLVVLSGTVWIVLILVGLSSVFNHAMEPSVPARPPGSWPASSTLELDARRPTMVLFAHPRCPCTRASIRELARLVTQCGDRLAVYVLFCRMSTCPVGWERTDLWASAAAIPGIRVRADEDAREARCFGAVTSGQVVIYTPAGELTFSGGITASRGHSGDNFGRSAIAALVLRSEPHLEWQGVVDPLS